MDRTASLLNAWRGRSDHSGPDGSLFVCRWPAEGPQAYLHELYGPLAAVGQDLVRQKLEFDLPSAYREFLSEHNGARLFVGAISIGGVVDEVRRSPHIDDAQPVSLIDDLETFAAVSLNRWQAGWRRIGEITINRQWSIELSEPGSVAVVTEQRRQVARFADLWACLTVLIGLLAPSFLSDGRQLASWDELDRRLAQALGNEDAR